MIKVVVCDDQQLMRQGIANLLSYQTDMQIVGQAAHGEEACALARDHGADVVLMDIRMPVMNGIEATKKIISERIKTKILILTTFEDEELVIQALGAGASGYLLKDAPSEEIAAAIRSVHMGNTLLGAVAAEKVVAALAGGKKQSIKIDVDKLLTHREVEVLKLIGDGRNNREIAKTLQITEGTVKNHVTRILAQINARDRIQAALIARELFS
ncbi:MAG TPA: response regulator transcription factor [Planktothrix sp.]|jgi:DNA-binding NarL/FixJ family response regulator